MKKDRVKDKENMLKSMKFETDEDVELYEESIYNLVDEEDITCLYDLVEGYYETEPELPDMRSSLDSVIQDIWEYYDDRDYIKTMSSAIMKMKGKADESAGEYIYMFIRWEESYKVYLQILEELKKEELGYHLNLIVSLREEEVKYGDENNLVKKIDEVTEEILRIIS